MSGPGPILREAHRLRRHIKELETKIEQGPRTLKAHQNKLAQQEEVFRQTQDTLKQVKVRIHEKEVSVKATEQQIKKYEKQLGDVSSKKEYDALRAEIAASQEIIRKLEDETLELMAEAEEKSALLPEADKALQKARADFAQFEQDHKDRLARHAEDRARAADELKAIEATLPDDLKQPYQRMVAAKGADALSGVKGTICSACYTEITSQMSSDLRRDQYLPCRNCGRILYMEA